MSTTAAILYHAAVYAPVVGTICALISLALFLSWVGDRKVAR